LRDVALDSFGVGIFKPSEAATWPAFVAENRDRIVEAWNADAVGREWVERIAHIQPRGIIVPRLGGSYVEFSVVRSIFQRRCAYALLLMTDHRSEEAADVLLPLFGAAYHLEEAGSGLLAQMLPDVLLRQAYQVLAEVVAQGRLSASAKSRLAEALLQAPGSDRLLRQVFAGEELLLREVIDQIGADAKRFASGPSWLQALIYNPNRTERECREFFAELAVLLAARRDAEARIVVKRFENEQIDRFTIRNSVGRLIKVMAIPSFQSALKAMRANEPLRAGLLKELLADAVPK
jgi:hypothetical protein